MRSRWLRVLPGDECKHRVCDDMNERRANALNVEPIQPLPRCRLRTPEHWGKVDPRGARWLLSGGSSMVLGLCSAANCPTEEIGMPRGGKRLGAGRPTREKEGRTVNLASVRTTPTRLALYKIAAERADMTLTAWVEKYLDAAAK